jgi:diguanylate cyclase (GGDEF)-like protein
METVDLYVFQLASFLGQAAGAGIVAFVLFAFARIYRRDYHRLWGWSWALLAVYLALAGTALQIAMADAPLSLTRQVLSALSLAAAYWHLTYLLLGAYELATGRLVTRSVTRGALLIALVLAAVSFAAYATVAGAAEERLFIRFYVRAFLSAAAFLLAAWALRRGSKDQLGMAPAVVVVPFVLYGLEQMHVFALGVLYILDVLENPPAYVWFLGIPELLLLLIMGLGMILWILAEERNRVKNAVQEVERLVRYDPVTALPNRRTFKARLDLAVDQARSRNATLAVFLVDIDRFKRINDTLGQAFGDEVLRLVGGRLQRTLQAGDTVARWSSDIFAVLAPGVTSREGAETLARILRRHLGEVKEVHSREVYLTFSVGVVLYPDDGATADELVANAHSAMSMARDGGGSRYRLFEPDMRTRASERLELESELRHAVEDGQLTLVYQPVVRLPDRSVSGMEALLRWRHPERGIILPGEFLPVCEQMGIIHRFDLWVLMHALSQLGDWRRNGHRKVNLSVNLSAHLFQHPHLLPTLEAQMRSSRLDPSRVIVEVTETTAMTEPESALRTIRRLKNLGVRVAIDDFGTGYSSLSYLRQFQVDIVKIDRSFVHDLGREDSAAIVEGILALARKLRLRVVAEGVETEAQCALLQEMGCREVQGFLFARPQTALACERFLQEGPLKVGTESWDARAS